MDLLVGHLVGLVVLVGHLPTPTIHHSHEPGWDTLHHLAEHGLVLVHLPPAGHDCLPELRLGPWLHSLDLVLQDSPNLHENIEILVSYQ